MGYYKDRMIQEDEQGWSFNDGVTICWRCLYDPYLVGYIKDGAKETYCSFCQRETKKASAVPFDDVMEIITEAVRAHYNHADAETIPWDGEDKCYVGDTFDTYDMLHDDRIPLPSEREDVMKAIIDSFGDHVWCDRNFASLDEEQRYRFGWESFCRTVKHEIRYLFHTKGPQEFEDAIPVAQMLDEIGKLVNDYELAREIPAGTKFVRLRVHDAGEVCDTPARLGPPPPQRTQANRMSPAGISLFYAATDVRTARTETIPTSETDRECFVGGVFT